MWRWWCFHIQLLAAELVCVFVRALPTLCSEVMSAQLLPEIHKSSPLHLKNQYVQLPSLLLLKHSQTRPWAPCRTTRLLKRLRSRFCFCSLWERPHFIKQPFNPLNYVSAPVLFSPPVPSEVKAHQHLKVQKAIQRLEDSHETTVTEKQGHRNFLWDASSLFCTNSAMLWFSLRILVFLWSFVSADKCFASFSATLHVFCKCFTPIRGDFPSSCEYFRHFFGDFPSISTLEVIFVSFWLLCFTFLLFGCCFFLILYQFQVVSFACFAHFFAFQHCTRFQ